MRQSPEELTVYIEPLATNSTARPEGNFFGVAVAFLKRALAPQSLAPLARFDPATMLPR
jgi:hypothetical protein